MKGMNQAGAHDEREDADELHPGIKTLEDPGPKHERFGKEISFQKPGHAFQGAIEKNQADFSFLQSRNGFEVPSGPVLEPVG